MASRMDVQMKMNGSDLRRIRPSGTSSGGSGRGTRNTPKSGRRVTGRRGLWAVPRPEVPPKVPGSCITCYWGSGRPSGTLAGTMVGGTGLPFFPAAKRCRSASGWRWRLELAGSTGQGWPVVPGLAPPAWWPSPGRGTGQVRPGGSGPLLGGGSGLLLSPFLLLSSHFFLFFFLLLPLFFPSSSLSMMDSLL